MNNERVSGAARIMRQPGEVGLPRTPENERAGGWAVPCSGLATEPVPPLASMISVGGGVARTKYTVSETASFQRPGNPARRQRVSPPTRRLPAGRRAFSGVA